MPSTMPWPADSIPFTFHRSIFISYLILGVLLYLFYLRIGQLAADRPWLKLLAVVRPCFRSHRRGEAGPGPVPGHPACQ